MSGVEKSDKTKLEPLVAFVHIPKTAGSLINHLLVDAGKPGQDHIEQWLAEPDRAVARLRSLAWVSGHVPFPRMHEFLSRGTERPIRFFSAVRDPSKQIASHYNWLIEIYHKGQDFYDAHPARIKEISENIRKADNSNPSEVIEQIGNAPGLFLNQQARTLIGEHVIGLREAEIRSQLDGYEFVAHEATLGEILRRMFGVEPDLGEPVNKSPYHFDPGVFQAPEVRHYLEQNHALDRLIYDMVRSR